MPDPCLPGPIDLIPFFQEPPERKPVYCATKLLERAHLMPAKVQGRSVSAGGGEWYGH
jgi:hypothetical protein